MKAIPVPLDLQRTECNAPIVPEDVVPSHAGKQIEVIAEAYNVERD